MKTKTKVNFALLIIGAVLFSISIILAKMVVSPLIVAFWVFFAVSIILQIISELLPDPDKQ